MANLAAFAYLVSGILFILALRGLSHPTSSRQGNRFGMIGMGLAMATPLLIFSPPSSFLGVMLQIAVIDVVFSLDSVITAVGLVQHVEVMVAAIVCAVIVMMMAAATISRFVEDHPTIKMLAISFLLLIGLTLIGEGLDFHTPKGYIYFAMAFSFGVEILNIRAKRKRTDHLRLRKTQLADLVNDGGSEPR